MGKGLFSIAVDANSNAMKKKEEPLPEVKVPLCNSIFSYCFVGSSMEKRHLFATLYSSAEAFY